MKHRRQQGRITKIGASTGRHSLIFLVLNGSLRHCQCNLLDLNENPILAQRTALQGTGPLAAECLQVNYPWMRT